VGGWAGQPGRLGAQGLQCWQVSVDVIGSPGAAKGWPGSPLGAQHTPEHATHRHNMVGMCMSTLASHPASPPTCRWCGMVNRYCSTSPMFCLRLNLRWNWPARSVNSMSVYSRSSVGVRCCSGRVGAVRQVGAMRQVGAVRRMQQLRELTHLARGQATCSCCLCCLQYHVLPCTTPAIRTRPNSLVHIAHAPTAQHALQSAACTVLHQLPTTHTRAREAPAKWLPVLQDCSTGPPACLC
jgi:hypothetical protein